MALIDLFFGRKKTTAGIAKERLQIILAHERLLDDGANAYEATPSWLPDLQQELVTVIAKYIKINIEDLKVNLEKRDNLELLEINVTLPEKGEVRHASSS
ncbi:MAG: cell division topological specificity factor MinE [Burkholderiales bacterium]|nr:cell division topological specificity factor MinE [Burkholderiales bacterium]